MMKTTPGPGVPKGTSDIFFALEGFYGFIECKASKTAKFQPGQKEFIAKMNEWSWARVVYPAIWSEVQKELTELLR